MFGYDEFFEYIECSKCGCLQISQIPTDMEKYYPLNYYSFEHSECSMFRKIKNNIGKQRDRYALTGHGIVGLALQKIFPPNHLDFLVRANVMTNLKILDVGCGSGNLLKALGDIGFNKLHGIDPYLKEDIKYDNGVKIQRKNIHELNDEFDIIMFNHSFEHISDPSKTLKTVSRLLSKNGTCIIRIPTVSSFAWKKYNVNWVQLDAPRHFFLYSLESIKLLASKSKLILNDFFYDSTDFQFWGSEQYLQDISLISSKSYYQNPMGSIFSEDEIRLFKEKAIKLNLCNQGDQVVLYFTKKSSC